MKRVALIQADNRFAADPLIRPLDYAEADGVALAGLFRHRAGFDQVETLLARDDRCILDTAAELCAPLGPGDLFVFVSDTHGVQVGQRLLLLTCQAKFAELEFFRGVVPVDLLKLRTNRPGLQRLFILDVCRSPLLRSDRDAVPRAFAGVQALARDVTAAPVLGPASAPLTILCSCDEGCQALEHPSLRRGLFSLALEQEIEAALARGVELRVADDFKLQLRDRMARLAAAAGLPAGQRPWLQSNDQPPVLVLGRPVPAPLAPGEPPPPPQPTLVTCPLDGLHNDPGNTFRCRLCGRDHLCKDHFVKADRCCEECAKKLAGERADAERKAKEEAVRRAREEAARQAELQRQEIEKQRLETQRKQAEAEKQARQEAERKAWEEAARLQREEEKRRKNPRFATKDRPWENSLGMTFVPVPGTEVLFGVWDVRVKDFEAFVGATGHDATSGMYSVSREGWKQQGNTWKSPGFSQGPTHPVVGVSWEDAQAFCRWLTQKESNDGVLGVKQSYRLPTDAEWSVAVGLPAEPGATPRDKDGKNTDLFPWGTGWPPPKGAGNYGSSLNVDSFAYTSPVGSFAANQFGLYDLGGNVWQWCNDEYYSGSGTRVLRGASWYNVDRDRLLSSYRGHIVPGARGGRLGFRVVVAGGSAP